MERRFFGIRIPGILPDGDFSVFNRPIDTTVGDVLPDPVEPKTKPREEPFHMGKIHFQILEALDSLNGEEVREAGLYSIMEQLEELHPPKHWWNTIGPGTLYRAVLQLEEAGQIRHRDVRSVAPDGRISHRFLYHRVREETPPAVYH